MAVALPEWLDLMSREYVQRFIPGGGSAVKLVIGDDAVLDDVQRDFKRLAADRGLYFVPVDAAATKLHMIQDVFFAIARAVDWEAFAQHWVQLVFRENSYVWPRPDESVPLKEIAAENAVAETLLRREVHQWLTARIMRDRDLAQDFRTAMAHLCLRRMEPAGEEEASPPVIEWLRGELRTIGAVRRVPISAKITRHNGRAMLRSLCHWLRLSGGPGLVVTLDLRQIGRTTASAEGVRYSRAAVLDAFEVLRQLIDESENLEGLMVIGLADESLVDPLGARSIEVYPALKMRVWSDVRARGRDNPLAPLVELTAREGASAVAGSAAHMPFSIERMAVEAARAGVPNRAAIRLLGSAERTIAERFVARLDSVRGAAGLKLAGPGDVIAGGFGAGKSHLLGFLAEEALQRGFVVSRVSISKETPLFDPGRLFAAAMRNAVVPEGNDDVMSVVVHRLDPRSPAYEDLESWASDPASELSQLFPALLYLIPRQVTGPEDVAAIGRFFGGGKLGIASVRQWLRAAGALKLFDVAPVTAAELALQRIRFAPALFRAAGFSGWCLLLDEVELIGRYSTLQRGKSYAEMARWLDYGGNGIPGAVGAAAITDDFRDQVMDARLDPEKVPAALAAKGLEREAALARLAMEAIEPMSPRLTAPDEGVLQASLVKLGRLYDESYDWRPRTLEIGERLSGKTMRQYIKSWITEWDIERLYGEHEAIESETLTTDYSENPDLEQGPPPEDEEG